MATLPMTSKPTAEDLEQNSMRYVTLSNHQLLHSASQMQNTDASLELWRQTHPKLFNKRPYDRPGRFTK